MKMRRYNLLSIPFFAFFSKRAYHDVGRNWKGINFAYLFLLMAVCCLPPTLTLYHSVIQSIEKNQQHLVKQIPDISITDGRVVVDQRQPCYITRKDGTTAIIIDTTGSMNFIEDPNVIALLMESSLIVRTGKDSFNTFDLSEVSSFHLDPIIADGWMTMAKESLAPVSYGFFLLFSFLFAIVVMFLAATVGTIVSHAMHGTLSFAGALRIATVAATPSIIFMTISATLGMGIATEIHAAVALLYFIAGIKVCSKTLPADEKAHIDLKSYLHEDDVEAQHAA